MRSSRVELYSGSAPSRSWWPVAEKLRYSVPADQTRVALFSARLPTSCRDRLLGPRNHRFERIFGATSQVLQGNIRDFNTVPSLVDYDAGCRKRMTFVADLADVLVRPRSLLLLTGNASRVFGGALWFNRQVFSYFANNHCAGRRMPRG
jgi:hypothetical protein